MNKKILIIPKQIVTVNPEMVILRNHGVQIENGIIVKICDLKNFDYKKSSGDIYVLNNLTMLPGFIQTHVHLCQSLFRGLADDMELLDWLQKRIFPYENNHDKNSLKLSVQLGINELIESGTTTILDMGTMNHQEVIFEEMIASGIRGFSGKCMIDENDLYPTFKETTEKSLSSTYELAKRIIDEDWHSFGLYKNLKLLDSIVVDSLTDLGYNYQIIVLFLRWEICELVWPCLSCNKYLILENRYEGEVAVGEFYKY